MAKLVSGLRYGFFDGKWSNDNSKFDRLYSSGQISEMFNGVIRDGVYLNWAKGKMTVTKTEGYERYVTVSPGKAWFDGTWTILDDDYLLEVPARSEEDRTDYVVLEINKTDAIRANRILIVNEDDLVDNSAVSPTAVKYVKQYPLASIFVKAADPSSTDNNVHNADIKNLVGTDRTPYFAWILQDLSIGSIVDIWSEILGITTLEFDSWFSIMKSLLGYGDEAYSVILSVLQTTEKNDYISRILPRVNELIFTTYGDGTSRTFNVRDMTAVDILTISNVRVNGEKQPYSVHDLSFTFLDAPSSGAEIKVRVVPNINRYSLYFEEPTE